MATNSGKTDIPAAVLRRLTQKQGKTGSESWKPHIEKEHNMKLWNIFSDWLESDGITAVEIKTPDINPANGLPMLEGGAIDIEGNPFGTDALDHSGPDFSGWTDDL